VVQQAEIEFLYKKLNIFCTTSASSGVHERNERNDRNEQVLGETSPSSLKFQSTWILDSFFNTVITIL
jgi:hypothetical protein